ncbi:MAG: hypothetical protein HN390_13985 [Anaerolineae bacterium]|nr:hypothetical protein [Anaerolineae bacterium]MBT7191234.1 hypothetical protein [Anaerolineae bacterium]MBT7988999.1 hypothetical protein [Anaerolineae bacterium]
MVHALQEIRDLLKPDGFLIDIRPNGEMVEFIRPHGSEELFIGHLQETDDYIEYRQAEAAVQEVVADGIFRIKKADEFIFQIHADSFAELKSFLDKSWSDSLITEEVIAEARRLDDAHDVGKVILREQVYIKLLLPVF